MGYQEVVETASALQVAAAKETERFVRVIAGPGSGKSKVIADRVRWLLDEEGARPRDILVLSFTNASVRDLRLKLANEDGNTKRVSPVRVSTIHSLALGLLRQSNLLEEFVASPSIIGEWETDHVFDEEFKRKGGPARKGRREEVRRYFEASWETGLQDHPAYTPPDIPITADERDVFQRFHGNRTTIYCCVYPGEVVRRCLDAIETGLLDLAALLQGKHVIVDEFQDLNPADLEFVRAIGEVAGSLFVAGDDDQSIYSFRFADPKGIRDFPSVFASSTSHELRFCFRNPPAILDAAVSLILSTQGPNRVPKHAVSVDGSRVPARTGTIAVWRFADGEAEADGIAQSCRELVSQGVQGHDILVLLRNQRALWWQLRRSLEAQGITFTRRGESDLANSRTGVALGALLRIIAEQEGPQTHDYLAYRILLGLVHGVGPTTCNEVADTCAHLNRRYREIFTADTVPGGFSGRAMQAIESVRSSVSSVSALSLDMTIQDSADRLASALDDLLGIREDSIWEALAVEFPSAATLGELREYLMARDDYERSSVIEATRDRLGNETQDNGLNAVRIMSIHGSKGLSAPFVFVPGLESGILPASQALGRPSLLEEEARMLYVAITRASAATYLSFAQTRFINGAATSQGPSSFIQHLGIRSENRTTGLTNAEAAAATAMLTP